MRSGRLYARCLLQAQFPDGLLSHLELLDLAANSHGEVVHEFDVPGDLEMGDPAPAEILDLPGAGRCSLLELDPGHDLLAILFVRNAYDLDIAYGGMGVEELLYLPGVDVLP